MDCRLNCRLRDGGFVNVKLYPPLLEIRPYTARPALFIDSLHPEAPFHHEGSLE